VVEADWEQRVANAWASVDQPSEADFLARIDQLAADLPADSALGSFEQAAPFDSTGRPDRAVPLYRQAVERGQPHESVALLTRELDAGSDHLDDAVRAFLALGLVDVGRERKAVAQALAALAPHLPRYQRSLANYARLLGDADVGQL
jgi:Tetratrico peptide repeat